MGEGERGRLGPHLLLARHAPRIVDAEVHRSRFLLAAPQLVDQERVGDDLRVEQIFPFLHRETGQLSGQGSGDVSALNEVDDLLTGAHRRKGPLPETQSSIAAEEERNHSEPRVADDVSHQAQFQLRRQSCLLAGTRGPCRDELRDALQILAGVFHYLAKPLGRHAPGRLGRRVPSLLGRAGVLSGGRCALHFLEEGVQDQFGGQRCLRRLQAGEGPQFLVLPQLERPAQEVPMTPTLGRDLGWRPKLDEVLVERAEQVERKLLREGDLALRQKETQPRGLRQDFVERLFVERVVDDRAPRDGRCRRPEHHDGTP